MEDELRLIERTNATLKGLEDAEVKRLAKAFDLSYASLEADLLRQYPQYTADAKPDLLGTQRGLLLTNELQQQMILLRPEQEPQIKAQFERLLNTSSKEGETLAEELVRLQRGDEFVKATATIPIEAAAVAAVDSVKRLNKHSDKFREEASVIITQGVVQGWGAQRVAQQLRSRTGIAKGRAEAIARTEVLHAHNRAAQQFYSANGVAYVQWIATSDERTCAICLSRAGQVYEVGKVIVPAHVNCLVGETLVSAAGVKSGTSRQYVGEVVRIETASGKQLTATPNHPILTDQGWVAIGLLKEGSNVFSRINGQRISGTTPDRDHRPTAISEIVRSFRESDGVVSVSVESTPEQFHGDGKGSKVSIVSTNRLLRNDGDLQLFKPLMQGQLVGGSMGQANLLDSRSTTLLLPGNEPSPNCTMCGSDLTLPLSSRHLLPLQSLSFGLGSGLNIGMAQNSTHGRTLNSELVSNGFLRSAANIEPYNFISNWGVSFNESRRGFLRSNLLGFGVTSEQVLTSQGSGQSGSTDPDNSSSVLSTLAGQVFADRVINITRVNFSGHVYNVETEKGWYIANDIVTHNCRCFLAPYFPEFQDESKTEWAREYAKQSRRKADAAELAKVGQKPTPFEQAAGVIAPVVWRPDVGYQTNQAGRTAQRAAASWASGLAAIGGLSIAGGGVATAGANAAATVGVSAAIAGAAGAAGAAALAAGAGSAAIATAATNAALAAGATAAAAAAVGAAVAGAIGGATVGAATGAAAAGGTLATGLLLGAGLVGMSVGAYYLARARYRNGFRQSAQMARDMAARYRRGVDADPDSNNEQLTFVVGGFSGEQGTQGLYLAEYFQTVMFPNHRLVGVRTPEFDVEEGGGAPTPRKVSQILSKMLGTAVIDGRNPAAVRMAAQAYAFHERFPDKPVNLIGYSGGGFTAFEAAEILKEMGVTAKVAAIGTPYFGFNDLPSTQAITLAGENDIWVSGSALNPVSIKGVKTHALPQYLENEQFQQVLKDFFGGQRVATDGPEVRRDAATSEIVRLYPEMALMADSEIAQLPELAQQQVLAAKRQAAIVPAQPTAIELADARKYLAEVQSGIELGPVFLGRAVLERWSLLPAKEWAFLPEQIRKALPGFKPKGALPAKPEIIQAARTDLTLFKRQLEAGIELGPVNWGEAVLLDRLALLSEAELATLPGVVQRQLAGWKEKLLTGRLDPKQLPATSQGRQQLAVDAIYKQLAKEAGLEEAMATVMRGQLPDPTTLFAGGKLAKLEAVEIPAQAQTELQRYTAQQLYQQARSVDRGLSRLAGFRVRQKLAEIGRQQIPPGQKLNAYRQAIYDEVAPLALPPEQLQPPGVAEAEELQVFGFGGLTWATPPLKANSQQLDLIRKLVELDLPASFTEPLETIYFSRQKNASEQYWRKKLKLPTARVPASMNLEAGAITIHGRADVQDVMRQMGYLVAYRKFGQLEPPKGSQYDRATAEGRTITPYGFSSPAADFADSVAQFFLDPDRLKKFNPARYNAISSLLNYRHPVKPVVTVDAGPDPRGTRIIENLRTRSREISATLKSQRETAETLAAKQRSTKKFQAQFDKINLATVTADSQNAASRSRATEEGLDRLEQSVLELEQRYAQILSPFNEPYFGTVPKQITAASRTLKTLDKELLAIDKAAAASASLRTSAAELAQTLSDLSTRRDSLKTSDQGRDLELAWGQLVADLDSAEAELIELPRSTERAAALRDMVRIKAAIRAQESAVGVDVAALHRQAIQPKIDQIRALAENLEAVQVRLNQQRDRLSDYQTRLARLPQKLADLDPDTRARYNTVKATKSAQAKLPQRVEAYRSLKQQYTGRLAEMGQTAQKLLDDYANNRPAAINSVQASIEDRLQSINDSLTVLASLDPRSVAWLVDSANWEFSDPPPDLAIVLAGRPERSRTDKLRAAAAEITQRLGQVRGSANVIEQRIDYIESLSQSAREQLQAERRKWEQIRTDLSDDQTLTDRQIQQFLNGERPAKAIDVVRYGNQLVGDLEAFNQDFVRLLLGQEGVDPRTIIDQSELYRRARDSFAAETEQTRLTIAGEIDQALSTLGELEQRLTRDANQQIVLEVGGKARTLEQLRAELAAARSTVDSLLRIDQVDIAVESEYVDVARGAQRQAELDQAERRNRRVTELEAELAEVNREIRKREEARDRGQKRGIATDRLEATRRRILRDIEKTVREDT